MQVFHEIGKHVAHTNGQSISNGWDYSKFSSNQHTTVPAKLLLGPQILNREAKTRYPVVI